MMPGVRSITLSDSQTIQSLIRAIADSISLTSGYDDSENLLRRIASQISYPAGLYLKNSHWPSQLTAYGVPLELSLSLDGSRSAFRYVTDNADHRFSLSQNWTQYLTAANECTGVSSAVLSDLFTSHLDVNPPTTRSPVYIGQGYGSDGQRRGTIYFFIGGISQAGFEQRYASDVAALDASFESVGGRRPDRYHGVAYDFDESGTAYRTKYYAWLDRDPSDRAFFDLLGNQQGLMCSKKLMDHLAYSLGKARNTHSTLLQSSISHGSCNSKIFLNAQAWSFDRPHGLRTVIQWLADQECIDLSPLFAILDIFSARGIALLPLWLAMSGPIDATSITFYFEPILDPSVSGKRADELSQDHLNSALERGVRYLLGRQLPQGGWPRDLTGGPDLAITSQLALSLSSIKEAHGALAKTSVLLSDKELASTKNPQVRALAMLAAHRLVLKASCEPLPNFDAKASPECIAMEMLATLEMIKGGAPQLEEVLSLLSKTEQWSGGWSGIADDLYVTVRVIELLKLIFSLDLPGSSRALEMMTRAAYIFVERPIAAEAAKIALWLKGRLLCGSDLKHASVDRALSFLVGSQMPDGRWLPTPFEKADGSSSYLDPQGLMTTAMVVETLALILGSLTDIEQ